MPRPQTAMAVDFAGVLSFLQERGIVSTPPPGGLVANARRIHSSTYSLILWRFRLRGLPEHGQVFIEEIASDALQVLPQVLMGFSKTAKLLMRGVLENTLRHLYFSDHPIEFARMNREGKWFMTVENLLEYLKAHPLFLETEKRFDAVGRVASVYSDLSAGVHGRRVTDLEMRSALQQVRYNNSSATREAVLVQRCAEATNFLLAVFHHKQMRAFQAEDRSIILRTLPARARQVWTHLSV